MDFGGMKMELADLCNENMRAATGLCTNAFMRDPLYDVAKRIMKDPMWFPDMLFAFYHVSFRVFLEKQICKCVMDNGRMIGFFVLIPPNRWKISILDYVKCGILKLSTFMSWKELIRYTRFVDGMIMGDVSTSKRDWHLCYLAVSPHKQGNGMGTKLIREFILPYVKEHGGQGIVATANNARTVTFYERNGFHQIDKRFVSFQNQSIGNWTLKCEL